VQTGARQLTLERALDERIDHLPRSIDCGSLDEPEGLWVLGSELRLHQVLTNLATNAVKYTPEGGGLIRISTEFLGISTREELPGNPPDIEPESEVQDRSMEKTDNTRSGGVPELHGNDHATSPGLRRNGSAGAQTQCLNFRMEVSDSGPGVSDFDVVPVRGLIVLCRLSPLILWRIGCSSPSCRYVARACLLRWLLTSFSQTTVGRSSGSGAVAPGGPCRMLTDRSGTGLGLAIVKQIIRLSGGRLVCVQLPLRYSVLNGFRA
jgi:signal transduction histidine kinase